MLNNIDMSQLTILKIEARRILEDDLDDLGYQAFYTCNRLTLFMVSHTLIRELGKEFYTQLVKPYYKLDINIPYYSSAFICNFVNVLEDNDLIDKETTQELYTELRIQWLNFIINY